LGTCHGDYNGYRRVGEIVGMEKGTGGRWTREEEKLMTDVVV
jgi:hypothetical protein